MQKNAWKICFNAYSVSHTTSNQQRWESPTYLTAFHVNVSICFFLLFQSLLIFLFFKVQAAEVFWREMNWTDHRVFGYCPVLPVAFTKEIHFRLLFMASGLESLKNGIVWIEMPFFSSFVLLQPYTTHFCTISLRITNSVVTRRNDQTAK